MTTRVDVLLPVFNRRELLPMAVESILTQSMKDFRLVIYDDGSDDGSTEDLPPDPRIFLIRDDTNRGPGVARTRLLEAVEAPYACWQDSDDVAHPHRLQVLTDFLGAHPKVDMVLSYMHFFKHPSPHTCTRTIYKVDTSKFGQPNGFWDNLTFATGMFRRHLAEIPFNAERATGGEDVEWMRRLVEEGTTFAHVARSLYYCRRHPGRMTEMRRHAK